MTPQEIKIEQLKDELVSFYRMAEKGIWVGSEDYLKMKEENSRLKKGLKSAIAAMSYAWEDRIDRYYVNVKEELEAILKGESNE